MYTVGYNTVKYYVYSYDLKNGANFGKKINKKKTLKNICSRIKM